MLNERMESRRVKAEKLCSVLRHMLTRSKTYENADSPESILLALCQHESP